MTGLGATELHGVANLGNRPTFDGGATAILETHLFDFNQDIYGHYVEVHFKAKLRDEIRFDSLAALREQINRDVLAAQAFFAKNNHV
jgi:riboflavin kinase/FMN adenylyltransferase